MSVGIQAARFLTSSPQRTALLGAGVGAAAGALRAPQEGQTRGQAMLGGAIRGGALAGGAAALGRGYRDTRLLNPTMSATQAIGGTAKRMGEGLSRFGKRQIHGVTGAFEHDAIGMAGNARSAEKVHLLERRMADELAHAPAHKADAIRKGFQGQIAGEQASGRASQALADAGITTLPGTVRALADGSRRGAAFRAMGKSITDGPGGAVMSLGVPLAFTAPTLLRGDESAIGGQTMRQKALGLGVNIGTGMAFGGLPMIPQMAAGIGTDAAVGWAGKKLKNPPHMHGDVPAGIRS